MFPPTNSRSRCHVKHWLWSACVWAYYQLVDSCRMLLFYPSTYRNCHSDGCAVQGRHQAQDAERGKYQLSAPRSLPLAILTVCRLVLHNHVVAGFRLFGRCWRCMCRRVSSRCWNLELLLGISHLGTMKWLFYLGRRIDSR